MSVYFARVGRYVKIGHSDNPERRVARLFKSATRYCMPADCPTGKADRELLLTIPGRTSREAECHAALEDYRAVGEFFVDEPGVRHFMDEAAAGRFPVVSRPGGPFAPDCDESHLTPEIRAQVDDAISLAFAGVTTSTAGISA